MKFKVPFIRPSFPGSELVSADYEKILESNWFTNFGPFEKEFRLRASEFIGDDVDACTVANATLGLDIAIRALLKKTDVKNQVLVPSFTFAAGPEMLIANGFKPVFIDIDKDNMQPDLAQAKKYIDINKEKVAGILLCNIFGVGNPEISKWGELASRQELPLIIDSAAGFGSRYDASEMVGVRGDCEIFSLHATKPFAVGEGGLIVSKNKSLVEHCRHIENFGFDETRKIGFIGTNAKLPELSCAIGLRQLDGFDERLNNRRSSLKKYKELLKPQGFDFQANDELSTVPFVTVLAKSPEDAQNITQALLDESIEVRNYYRPLHDEKVLMGFCKIAESLDVTDDVASRVISLPLHDNMDEAIIGRISDIIKNTVGKK